MATIAVFVALGGTSYALTLPRNSVGAKELRADAVGKAELRRGAVTSAAVRNRSIRSRDLTAAARERLRGSPGPAGPQGPAGVTYAASLDPFGTFLRGNAQSTGSPGSGGRIVGFAAPTAGCVAAANIIGEAGYATTEPSSDGRVLVRTYDATGVPKHLAFNLIVAC